LRVFFLIRSLDVGGAERQINLLARGLKSCGHDVAVAVFYAGGTLERSLKDDGITLINIKKKGRWDITKFFRTLVMEIRSFGPDVLYGCLPAANICVILARPFVSDRVVLLLRLAAAHVDLSQYDQISRLSYWLEARLSRFSDLVLVNSKSGKRWARKRGISRNRLKVIPNGIDVKYFRPDAVARKRLRRNWHIPESAWLFGLVGRFDPVKDHATFLQAPYRHVKRDASARFVFVGDTGSEYAKSVYAKAVSLDLVDKLIWTRGSIDMPAIYSAIDVLTCCSRSEGFPNVVGEAMACETPCVATDVGDCRWIIGDTGKIVPVGCSLALADAWQEISREPTRTGGQYGKMARERIAEKFSDEQMIRDTESTLRQLTVPQPTGAASRSP